MKNLIEYTTKEIQRAIAWNIYYKLVIVLLLALLVWQSNSYSNYKKLAENKANRDLASINGYKQMMP